MGDQQKGSIQSKKENKKQKKGAHLSPRKYRTHKTQFRAVFVIGSKCVIN